MPWASSGGCSLVGGCGGLSCLEDGLWGTWLGRWARGSRAQAQCLGHTGLVALQRVGPSRVRNRTRVPCVVGELYTTEPPGKPKGQLLFVFLFPFHFDPFNFKLLVGVQLLREAPVLAVGRSESATCVRPPRPGGSSRGSPRSFEWSPLSKVSSQRHAQTPVCGAASADTRRRAGPTTSVPRDVGPTARGRPLFCPRPCPRCVRRYLAPSLNQSNT